MNHFENFNQIQELDTESNTPVKAHNSYPNLTINLKSLDENEKVVSNSGNGYYVGLVRCNG